MYLILPERNGKWVYDPATSMAIQVYVKDYLRLDDDALFPYMMTPAIQIGKFQNAYEEVNQAYLEEKDIKVIRRDTGGGAIYMDDKNMSFVFLLDGNTNIFGNYKQLYDPAIRALKKLGVENIEQAGRNDLTIEGKKVSGAAMTLENGRIYCGYSLLLDPNYEAMLAALNPNQKKIQSHGIKSIKSRVGAIRPYLSEAHRHMDVWEFTEYMICELLGISHINEAKQYRLTNEDWQRIDRLTEEKYNNWDWTYGEFREFEFKTTERFQIGTITFGLTVKRGKIKDIQITGDFFGQKDIHDLEEALKGKRYKKDELESALSSYNLSEYFGDITVNEIVDILLSHEG